MFRSFRVTVQRRCRFTYLFPAGATPRRPAEPLPAQSPPPPALGRRRDAIRSTPPPAGPPARSAFSVVPGRGVGPDIGGATTALLQWPETRCGAGVRAAPPCVARRRAAAPRRRVTPSPRITTYRAQHCVAPGRQTMRDDSGLPETARDYPRVPETTQDHPRLSKITRDDPGSPEITGDCPRRSEITRDYPRLYPRRPEITRDYLRFPSLPEITRDCPG